DKITAYIVLHDILVTMAYLVAPFTPFMAETVYQNLVANRLADAPESIHMCDFPVFDTGKIDTDLERDMDRVLEWVSLGRAARNNAQLKIRQPLSEMIVVGSEPLSEELASLVRDELNVKALSFEEDDRRLIDFTFKPQLRTLGRVMGGDLPKARPLIEALPGRKTMDALDAQGKIELDVDGTLYTLTAEDLLAEEVPMTGFAVEGTGDVKVALVTELTESLIEEGLVREIVSKVQTMRRAHDFEVTDRITLFIKRDEREAVLDRYADAIMTDVLADQIIFFDDNNALPAGVSGEKWDINGHEMAFAVVVS
ncbi:MAG: DUF5915 domain-containing protein, partial [Clostridiales bacterium]|nr:DUF5915 domain-containing protein [Clostridiales bacterium]